MSMGRWFILAACLLWLPSLAMAAGGEGPMYHFEPDSSNEASLQRGFRLYMNYCAGCHSLKYMRYNRIGKDLNIPEEVLEKNLLFTADKTGSTIEVAMPERGARDWFGQAPPDLSLTARARGPDWIYSYLLTFYLDEERPMGVNNLTLEGASMPHVLWSLQGWQKLKDDHDGEAGVQETGHAEDGSPFEVVQEGEQTPKEYQQSVADITNFLVYVGEPVRVYRYSLGFKVILFLLLFTALAYLLKREYWKDVH